MFTDSLDKWNLEQVQDRIIKASKASDAARTEVQEAESSVARVGEGLEKEGDVAHEMCPATCAIAPENLACTGCWDIVESIEMFAQELPCPNVPSYVNFVSFSVSVKMVVQSFNMFSKNMLGRERYAGGAFTSGRASWLQSHLKTWVHQV